MDGPRTVALRMHAAYRCRHSGVCCSAGWRIPVEHGAAARIRNAVSDATLRCPPGSAGVEPLLVPPGLPSDYGGVLAHRANGACIFFDHDGARLCEVHRVLGEAALGQACRQFPRMASHDARGTEVSLSHFCPTAARLLAGDAEAVLVEAPAEFPGAETWEGLEARDALPPLLRPGVLCSFESWTTWQRFVIEMLATRDSTMAALAAVCDAAERLRAWDVGMGGFDRFALAVLAEVRPAVGKASPPAIQPPSRDEAAAAWDAALGAVPSHFAPPDTPDWSRWAEVELDWHRDDRVLRRYLAARSVGAWVAYQGRGVRSWVRWLVLAWHIALAERCRPVEPGSPTGSAALEAVRRSDLLLVHLADPQCLADTLSTLELHPLRTPLLPFDAR